MRKDNNNCTAFDRDMKEARDQAAWIEKETAAHGSERLPSRDKILRGL